MGVEAMDSQQDQRGAPVVGMPVTSGAPMAPMHTVVAVADPPAGPHNHFALGCLSSGFCGCLGLITQRICWPSLRGNYGGCTGCVVNTCLGLLVACLMLALEQTLDYVKLRPELIEASDCEALHGRFDYQMGRCILDRCPPGFVEEGVHRAALGVSECSMKNILLVIRLIQMAVGVIVLGIAAWFCMRYRREVQRLDGCQQLPSTGYAVQTDVVEGDVQKTL